MADLSSVENRGGTTRKVDLNVTSVEGSSWLSLTITSERGDISFKAVNILSEQVDLSHKRRKTNTIVG